MSALPQPRLTVAAYLEIERAAEFRSEYFDGKMYAMSGARMAHVQIVGNAVRELGVGAPTGCSAMASDLRVATGPNALYTYPDIVVLCGEPQFTDAHCDTLLNPVVLIEVLSPSTEGYDRGFKAQQFRTMASLREFAFISQTEPRVEVYRRAPDGSWSLNEWSDLQSQARFESLCCSIPLSGIYRNVKFPAAPVEVLTARPAAARRTRSAQSSRR